MTRHHWHSGFKTCQCKEHHSFPPDFLSVNMNLGRYYIKNVDSEASQAILNPSFSPQQLCNLSKFIIHNKSQYTLGNGNNSRSYFIGMLWKLKDLLLVKHLKQFLACIVWQSTDYVINPKRANNQWLRDWHTQCFKMILFLVDVTWKFLWLAATGFICSLRNLQPFIPLSHCPKSKWMPSPFEKSTSFF